MLTGEVQELRKHEKKKKKTDRAANLIPFFFSYSELVPGFVKIVLFTSPVRNAS